MSWQRIELNMIPDTKVLPVVHASQFDSNRSISFQMFTGEDEWTIPEGLTIELHCRKVDDNIVTLAPLSVDGSVITFITTEQLTACSGQNKCELSFIDADERVIGSLNFILDVEPDPLKGGLTSASSIYDLTQQIEDIAQEVIGDDYYNKTEVDTLLADKADVSDLPDMSLYYTKTATDTLLNAKANTADLATVATSGDYDDLINKPDINAMIAAALLAVMPVETQTGNPCSFDTDIATALQVLTVDIVSSGGGGMPSTPIPIVGHSALNLDVNGDTFTVSFGQTVYGGVYDANAGKARITEGYLLIDENTPSLFYNGATGETVRGFIDVTGKAFGDSNILSDRFQLIEGDVVGRFVGRANSNGVEFYLPATVPHNTAGVKAWFEANNTQLVFELATPIEIDVSELSVNTIVGVNNITSDCGGDVTASYKVSIQKYVDDQ